MPSTSPGAPTTAFAQIIPGAPAASLHALSTFIFRHKRYIAYISGRQLNILSSPTQLVQVLTFEQELVAIAAESQTGKVVVAGKTDVHVLDPVTEGWTRVWWEKALALRRDDVGDEAKCLDWGSEGDVLVGGSSQLTLFSTLPSSRTNSPAGSPVDGMEAGVEERQPLWSKAVASPVLFAGFSPSASLIASCGLYDRLVKIWRRLSFEEGLFDYSYLPHPSSVTHMEWRPLDEHPEERRGSGISGRHEEDAEVLYTIASDGVLRVWRTGGWHDLDILALHATVDLVSAIPQSLTPTVNGTSSTANPTRYSFLLPSDQFCAAVLAATGRQTTGSSKVSHSLEHLKEVISRTPDIIVTLDGQGRMSAWGLQSIGHKRRPETPGSKDAFHIAHAEGLSIKLTNDSNARCHSWLDGDAFHVLVHDFSGQITWWQGNVETFFSPSAAGAERLANFATWSGHSTPITELRAGKDGTALISSSEDGEAVRWTLNADGHLQKALTAADASSLKTAVEPELDVEFKARGMANPSVCASNAELAALATSDGKELVIVDRREGYVEHRQPFDLPIRNLRCFTTAPSHNLLAVASDSCVDILAQGRYAGHHVDLRPTWITVNKISIADMGLRIAAIEWLEGGALVLAAGNGILRLDNSVSTKHLKTEVQQSVDLYQDQTASVKLPDLSRKLKESLPVWHPSLLVHMVSHGKVGAAASILHNLLEKLKFWSEGEPLPRLLDLHPDDAIGKDHGNDNQMNEDMVRDLVEQLDEKDLPAMSDTEQERLRRVIKALAFVSAHIRGLDKCALRYLFSWKLQELHMAEVAPQSNGTQLNGVSHTLTKPPVPQMHWREIAFAYHSTTQQPLLDILTLYYDNKLTWETARALGITAWLADKEALEVVFESLAQSAYRQSSPPDPINASLYFLALHKKPTLMGLWRIATWHREQRATLTFLKRDFSAPEAKTAAKKNAYALMGRRRFEYAAAFFLLADDAGSAVSLLAGQCGDVMLAFAVARLYGGDGSVVVRKLLEDRIMPTAEKERDRWVTSWCHAVLGQKGESAGALIRPLESHSGERTWHQDDPATLMLYRHSRPSSPSKHEYEAVLRAARILRRMGLWLLALEMVSQWHFQPQQRPEQSKADVAATNGITHWPSSMLDSFTEQLPPKQATSMLDGFASPTPPAVPAVMDEKTAREAKAAELLKRLKAKKQGLDQPAVSEKKSEPTQFKEPDANSLLDSFGF